MVILCAVLSETSRFFGGEVVLDPPRYAVITRGCLKRAVSYIDVFSVCSIAVGLYPTAQELR